MPWDTKKPGEPNRFLYRPALIDIINPNHELVWLWKLLDWEYSECEWDGFGLPPQGDPRPRPVGDLNRTVRPCHGV